MNSESQILTGVSGGSLCAAGVACGVSPQDGMSTVFHIAESTSKQGRLNALTPGFSLIDQVEVNFATILKQALGGSNDGDYDKELLQERLKGSRLRIGFTDRRIFPPFGNNTRAYFYIDEFRSVDDIVAACLLSSYIPFVTGPFQGSYCPTNLAVKRSMELVNEMVKLGHVKNGITGQPVVVEQTSTPEGRSREYFWDGGLVNVFPVVDDSTVIVTPIAARFSPNPYISPAIENNISTPTIKFDPRSEVFLHPTNVETLRQMTLAPDKQVLQERFSQGHDDARYVFCRSCECVILLVTCRLTYSPCFALFEQPRHRRFLEENNLTSVYSSGANPPPTSKLVTE